MFDRGFGNEALSVFLDTSGATFYIRAKAGRIVELDGQKVALDQIKDTDSEVRLFGLTLRVIRSDKGRRMKGPWYILTNDHMSSRAKIIRIYYHRFEIEEVFKDMKHIWELRRARMNRPSSLKVILWFVAIGVALLYASERTVLKVAAIKAAHRKKRLSWLRRAYEQLQRDITGCLPL